jgi:hypothetical protein
LDRWRIKDVYFVETPNAPLSQQVSNSLMWAHTRDHPFWTELLQEVRRVATRYAYLNRHFEIMYTTGPCVLSRVFHQFRYRYKLGILPQEYFHPLGLDKRRLTDLDRRRAFAVHYGFGAWEAYDSKLMVQLYVNVYLIVWIFFVLCVPQWLLTWF